MSEIPILAGVIDRLFIFVDAFKKIRRDRKDRIAVYFEQISNTLDDVVNELKENNYPHGSCARMQVYAERLSETIGDIIGKDEAEKLTNDLMLAHRIERLYSELHNEPDKDKKLSKLAEVSGRFKALADTIRAE